MNFLFTSIGRRNYIVDFFRDALKGDGNIIGVNSIAAASGMLVADKQYISPPIVSPDYIPFLLDTCKKENVTAVIPFLDMDVAALSNHKKEFEQQDVKVIVSDPGVILQCYDKLSYPDFLPKRGLKTPAVYTSLEEVLDRLDNQLLEFPLFLKPRWGTGSKLTEKAENRAELIFFFNLFSNRIGQTAAYTPVPDGLMNHILIQEFVEGEEYGLDVINDLKGNHAGSFIKKKRGMRSGETDGATTIADHPCNDAGKIISGYFRHESIIDIDFILTRNSEMFILDINPRFGGGYPFTHKAGVNLPACLIHWLKNEPADPALLQMRNNVTTVKGLSLHSMEE